MVANVPDSRAGAGVGNLFKNVTRWKGTGGNVSGLHHRPGLGRVYSVHAQSTLSFSGIRNMGIWPSERTSCSIKFLYSMKYH